MEDETGKKKAVSVSLGPGCRFVGELADFGLDPTVPASASTSR